MAEFGVSSLELIIGEWWLRNCRLRERRSNERRLAVDRGNGRWTGSDGWLMRGGLTVEGGIDGKRGN